MRRSACGNMPASKPTLPRCSTFLLTWLNARRSSHTWASPRRPMQCMPSKSPAAALRDIRHHIDLVVRFAAGLDYERFRDDDKTVYAVTRCLEIISEASRRLPAEIKSRHPDILWREMAGAGSVYRHDYDHVSARR